MKYQFLLALIFFPFISRAQHYERYYDFRWNRVAPEQARFYTELDKVGDLWDRKDYYVFEKSLQMEGSYTDTSCKVEEGYFSYYYPNKSLESYGKYHHGKKDSVWLDYYPNTLMQDSETYKDGSKVGINLAWHSNGYMADSSRWNADGSGIEISWFDNGNPSLAGSFSAGYKQNGRWQYFHKNGKLSALELYDKGRLIDKQYFDEDGKPVLDTTNKDAPATFPGGKDAWKKYILKNIYFPSQYQLANTDKAVVVVTWTIDENGDVTDAHVTTPLFPAFDEIALGIIKESPKWNAALDHNRHVKYTVSQAVYFTQE
jgi:antitoxin component YwqK of YwqJK toxin-antitoxin module